MVTKAAAGGSWQELLPSSENIRSSTWGHLLKFPSDNGNAQSLSGTSSSGSNFFYESPRPGTSGSFNLSSTNLSYQECHIADKDVAEVSGNYRRAALDFVLELAGPKVQCSSTVQSLPDTFVSSEEIPVPAFAVDRDMSCTFWNQKMVELSEWSRGDVMELKGFPSCLFSFCEEGDKRTVEDTLQAAFYGKSLNGLLLSMKARNGLDLVVFLSSSVRTDPVGAVSGMVCVVIPQRLKIDQTRSAEIFEKGLQDKTFQHGVLPASPEPVPFCGSSRPRALVFDAMSATRNSLASQLERCGIEATCAASAQEAAWRFEQSLQDTNRGCPFSVVFGELEAIRNENFSIVRRIRSLEEQSGLSDKLGETIVIATVSMNRWDLAGMDNEMDEGVTAGVDAVVPTTIKMQQLRTTLRKLGLKSKYLEVPSSLPRALSGALHNPLNLSR